MVYCTRDLVGNELRILRPFRPREPSGGDDDDAWKIAAPGPSSASGVGVGRRFPGGLSHQCDGKIEHKAVHGIKLAAHPEKGAKIIRAEEDETIPETMVG